MDQSNKKKDKFNPHRLTHDKFLQYVSDCIPEDSEPQKQYKKVILGLLLEDEKERLDEDTAIAQLQELIGQKQMMVQRL